MISLIELSWAAGLMEGEGAFLWLQGYPAITIEMTDDDVIYRFAALFPTKRKASVMHRKNKDYQFGNPRKDSYRYTILGKQAVAVMLTLYPFMGERRKERIREILLVWRSTPYYLSPGFNSLSSGYETKTRKV